MKESFIVGIIFWIILISLGEMIYLKYIPGIISFSLILLPLIFLYFYSKKKPTTKERFN